MHYTLHQLQIFLKITELQSITKASQALHLSQPAVSIQLKNLQDQFKIPLTEVIGRKLYITDFGKEIAIAAQNIINEVYAINYKTLSYQGKLSGKLKIAIVSTAKYIMPYFLTEFMTMHPDIELSIDVTNRNKVIESLETNVIDFALLSILPEHIPIKHLELLQNKLYLVGNSKLDFKKKAYPNSIFTSLPLIYREQGSGTRATMEKFIEKNKLPIQKKMEMASNEAVKQAVIAGLGCSIMPLIGIKNELQNGSLQIIPVQNFPIKSKWQLAWLKDKQFSPVANAYMNFLKKEKNNIIQSHFSWFEDY